MSTMTGRISRWGRPPMVALVLALGACGALSSPAPRLYTLTPAGREAAGGARADFQLLVETPLAAAGLDTQRIAVARTATSLDYLADAAWADRAPKMIQGLLVESFEDSRRILSVGRETVGLRADLALRTELRDFQAEYASPEAAAPNRARVRVAAKLVSFARRTIEAGESFEAVAAVENGGVAGVVEAFDKALAQVMGRIVAWTLVNGATLESGKGEREEKRR